MCKLVVLLLAVVIVLFPASDVLCGEIGIGSTLVSVPSQNGLVELTNEDQPFKVISDHFVPKEQILLRMYVTATDAAEIMKGRDPALKQYAMLLTPKELVHDSVSSDMFGALKTRLRGEYDKLGVVVNKINPELKQSSDAINSKYGLSLNLVIDRASQVEWLPEKHNSASFLALVRYADVNSEGEAATVMVAGTSVMLINGKVLLLNVYKEYSDQSSILDVRELVTGFLDAISSANSDVHTVQQGLGQVNKTVTRNDDALSRALSKGIGVFFVLMLVFGFRKIWRNWKGE